MRRGEVADERAASAHRGQPRGDGLVTDSQVALTAQIASPLDAPERIRAECDFTNCVFQLRLKNRFPGFQEPERTN